MLSADAIVELHDQRTQAWHRESNSGPGDSGEAPHAVPDADSNAGDGAHPDAKLEWLAAVERLHRANFDLWHIEDDSRVPGATDAEMAGVKRRVDRTNQRRNDLAEELDRALLRWLAHISKDRAASSEACEEHTAGAKAHLDSAASATRLKSCPDTHSQQEVFTQPVEFLPLPNPQAPLHSESPGLMIDRLSILALKIYHTREEAERADAPAGHAARNRERLAILEEQRNDLAGCLDALWRETLAGTRRFKLYRQLKMYNDPSLNPAIYRKSVKEPCG